MKSPLYLIFISCLAVYFFFDQVLVLTEGTDRSATELALLEGIEQPTSTDSMLEQTAALFGLEYVAMATDTEVEPDPAAMLENVEVRIQVVRSVNKEIEADIIGTFDEQSEKHTIKTGDEVFGFTVQNITPREIVFSNGELNKTIKVFKPRRLNETEEKTDD